jgi:hypothetical protein
VGAGCRERPVRVAREVGRVSFLGAASR